MPRGGARPGTGGKRPGAGRKKGSPNKATQARQRKAAASGSMPTDVMLKRMRFHEDKAEEARLAKDEEGMIRHLAMADEAARGAAPYFHPRLTAVQMSGGLTMTHEQALEKLK